MEFFKKIASLLLELAGKVEAGDPSPLWAAGTEVAEIGGRAMMARKSVLKLAWWNSEIE